MDYVHEFVTLSEGFPFKLFVFEGREGNYKRARHWHRSIEIFLVLEGNMDFYINETHYKMEAGQFILINSNEVHSIDCPNPNFTIVMQIPRMFFSDYCMEDDIMFKSQGCEEDADIIRLLSAMYRDYEQQPYGYRMSMLSNFYRLIFLLLNRYQVNEIDEKRKRQNRNIERLSKITDYIRENYREDITLTGVAGHFGFTPAYLSRIFQKYAGINYKSYLTDVRIEASYRLLRNTDKTVMQIAAECGFPDSRSMSGAFKKRYGMNPSKFRKCKK